MFKHLQEIDYKLYERYLTLEKNIKFDIGKKYKVGKQFVLRCVS